MRHSLAWNINMKMYWSDEQLKIEVKDDGIGREKSTRTNVRKREVDCPAFKKGLNW